MGPSKVLSPLDWKYPPSLDDILWGDDPRWFFELFCKIPTQDLGTVDFELWPWMHNLAARGITDKEIVLKSRDVGSSTFWIAEKLRKAITHPGRNLLIAADQQKSAVNLLNYARTILENLPDSIRPHIDKNNTEEIYLDKLNVRIAALPGTPDTGRSWRAYYLVCTEMAFWKDPKRYRAAVFNTLVPGGEVAIDSTANGVGNLYHQMWAGAKEDSNGYRPTFISVWENPNHTPQWYADKRSEYTSKDKADHLFYQEYAATEEEAFLASADNYFSQDLIAQGQTYVIPSTTHEDLTGPSGEAWGNVRTWRNPVPGQFYVAGVDVAEGKGGEDGDWSHATILEWRTGLQVAAIHSRQPDDVYSTTLYEWLTKYNKAYVAVERNGPGLAVIRQLQDHGHRQFFYHDKRVSNLQQEAAQSKPAIGWHTTPQTKSYLFSDLSSDLKSHSLVIPDWMFWDQAKTIDRNKMRARAGNDDAILATAIANQARRTFETGMAEQDLTEEIVGREANRQYGSWRNLFSAGSATTGR